MDKILAVSQELAEQGYPKYITMPEAILYGALGFLVVFLGIAFLILIVKAVGKFMQKDVPVAKKVEPKPAKKVEKEVSVATSTNEEEISEETIAVITAAIMAYYEKNTPKCEFTVRRIKKI
jgi:sodium pump decarboxylase gamma subunit